MTISLISFLFMFNHFKRFFFLEFLKILFGPTGIYWSDEKEKMLDS